MSEPYEELLGGEWHLRLSPGDRHERIRAKLHEAVHAGVANFKGARLLEPRTKIQFSPQDTVRPDLALVTAANHRLWLAVEIVSSDDHRVDTVVKKQLYEDMKVPRLWMVDPRYDNVEIYHSTPHGQVLKGILSGTEVLTDSLLPEFQMVIRELFEA
jgi:Uma2 family endonuclease